MANNSMMLLHTLGEVRQRLDPDGMIADIAEAIDEVNNMPSDFMWMEANDKTSHLYTKRVAYPTPSIRRLNAGVTPSKSTTGQDREAIMMLEDWSEVDVKLAGLSGNPAGYRYTEDIAFAEGFSQGIPGYMIYGSGADEEVLGLANRLNALSHRSVYGAGGTGGSLSSIYIVDHGVDVFGIYPTGCPAGLSYEDLGEETIQPALGTRLRVYQSLFGWDFGLVVRDDRKIARIANINVADPTSGTPAAIDNQVIYALNRMPRGTRGTGVTMYCNSDVMTIFDILAKDKTNGNYGWDLKFGQPVMMFRNSIPIRQVDQILSTEAQVS